MYTLGGLKTAIYMILDEYSKNGILCSVTDADIADMTYRMNTVADMQQRKLALTTGALRKAVTLCARPETNLAPGLEAELAAGEKLLLPSAVLSAETAVFSACGSGKLVAEAKLGDAVTAQTEYAFASGRLMLETFRRSVDFSSVAAANGTKNVYFLAVGKLHVRNTAFYAESFGETLDEAPRAGLIEIKQPDDFVCAVSVTDENGRPFKDVIIENGRIAFAVSDAGVYELVYSRYPERISSSTPDTYVLELDDYLCDALAHLCAAELCESRDKELYVRLRSKADEYLLNGYNLSALDHVPYQRAWSGNGGRMLRV